MRMMPQLQPQRQLLFLLLIAQQISIHVAAAFHVGATSSASASSSSATASTAAQWTHHITIAKAAKKINGFTTIIIDQTQPNENDDDDDEEKQEQKKQKKQKKQKHTSDHHDYEARRRVWEDRYGSVEALRRSFGTSPNRFWGDLDPESTRLLYHTLLPRSLLGLYEAGLMRPDELAPLAYQARKAAKEYARERSRLPGRLVAQAFDGFRSLRRNGKFKTMGISWEELWDKYEGQIVQEECRQEIDSGDRTCRIDETALADRIYLRILERSCATNQAFDRLLNKSKKKTAAAVGGGTRSATINMEQHATFTATTEPLPSLAAVSMQLENDVREILLNPKAAKKAIKYEETEQKKRREARKRKLLTARKLQYELDEEKRKQQEESSKWNKKRQRALQKALHKAAQRHRREQLEPQEGQQQQQQQQQEDEQEQHQDDDDNVEIVKNANNGSNNATTIVETFDTTKQADRVRRAYPVLRIMARTRRHLES